MQIHGDSVCKPMCGSVSDTGERLVNVTCGYHKERGC